jgi:predicted amidohydrolase
MMTSIRVAGAQLPVTTDIQANVAAIERAIDFAADENADILLTPEGSLSGYTHQFDLKAVRDALRSVTTKAREANLGLALGTCFVEDDKQCYNQIRFYRPDGEYLGFHSKTLTCGSLTEPPEGEISHYAVIPLRTFRFNDVQIGGLICNDMWANPGCTPKPDPHLSRQLSSRGARIVFHAVNGGRDGSEWSDVAWNYHESNLRMRARAGRLWIVTVDSCYPTHLRCSAPSGVIGPGGNWVCQTCPTGEQFFSCTVELTIRNAVENQGSEL